MIIDYYLIITTFIMTNKETLNLTLSPYNNLLKAYFWVQYIAFRFQRPHVQIVIWIWYINKW